MQYNLSSEYDKQRLRVRLDALVKRGAIISVTEKTKRTRSQNAYLHLVIGVVAMETGNSLDYVKQEYFKKVVNPSVFIVEKEDALLGRKVKVVRSSADLNPEEMSTAIDRFKRWAAENGIYIPEQMDEARLADIEMEMERCARYL